MTASAHRQDRPADRAAGLWRDGYRIEPAGAPGAFLVFPPAPSPQVYQTDLIRLTCTCPASRYGGSHCKHLRGGAALLEAALRECQARWRQAQGQARAQAAAGYLLARGRALCRARQAVLDHYEARGGLPPFLVLAPTFGTGGTAH